MTQKIMAVRTLSIYSVHSGGRNGIYLLHEKAITLAYQWQLLGGDYHHPRFDGGDNLVVVPKNFIMTLKYDENSFELFLDRGNGTALIAHGPKVEPAKNNPQQWGGHTVYASDPDFDYSFHGQLFPEQYFFLSIRKGGDVSHL